MTWIADCKVYPYYSATTKLRRNGLRGFLSEIEPTKLIEALLQDSRAETMFKAGRKVDLNYFLQHPMYFEIYSSYFAKVNTESVDDYQSVI